jgi:hypothetical protein
MKKRKQFLIRQSIILLILTVIFTIIVFFIKNYYFSDTHNHIEEQYIEPSIETHKPHRGTEVLKESKIDEQISGKEITQLIEEHYRAAAPFYFEYFPENFERQAQ